MRKKLSLLHLRRKAFLVGDVKLFQQVNAFEDVMEGRNPSELSCIAGHIGRRVKVTTREHGVYVGMLVDVFEQRWKKFRAKVRIDGYLAPASHSWSDLHDLTIVSIGEFIECDSGIVELTELRGVSDYSVLLDVKARDLMIEHEDFVSGKFGDPSDPRLRKLHGWREGGAKVVRAVAERSRGGSQDLADRVSAERDGDRVKVVLPFQFPEIMKAVAALGPGKRFFWLMSERAWVFPSDGLEVVMAALGSEEICEIVRRKLNDLAVSKASLA